MLKTKKGFRSMILIIITLLFGALQLRLGSCDILIKPRHTEVLLNHSTYLNCSTSRTGQEIHWKHGEQHVYAGGQLYSPYHGRFLMEEDLSSGISNLIISSATLEDAGTYTCQENAGRGNYSSAELVVLGEETSCTTNVEEGGIIGVNDCGLKTEDLLLSCNVSYYGNIPPKLEWWRTGEEVPFSLGRTQENDGSKAICNQTIRSDRHIDGSSYVCHSSRMVTKEDASLCSSDTVKLFYVLGGSSVVWMAEEEKVFCSVNSSSQQCSFKWKWYSDGKEVTVSNDKQITTNSTGLYRCEAYCNVKSSLSCRVVAMTVLVNSTEHAAHEDLTYASNSGLVAALVVVIIILVFTAIAWFIYSHRSKQKKSLKKEEIESLLDKSKKSSEKEVENLKKQLEETKDASEKEMKNLKKQLEETKNASEKEVGRLKKKLQDRPAQSSEPRLNFRHASYRSSDEDGNHLEGMDLFCSIPTNRKEKVIKSLSVLDDEIFVLSQWSSTVEVYDINQLPAKCEPSQ